MNQPRTIEQLKDEYNQLNERKIQAKTQLETATKELEKLQAEAVEQFGTSDIEELQAKLKEMEAENEKRRKEYQELLDGIATDLKQVEAETAAGNQSQTESADD